MRGHHIAHLDPLDIVTPEHSDMFPELNLNHVGLGKNEEAIVIIYKYFD